MFAGATRSPRMTFSIKDHPFYIRMKQLPPQEIAAWVLGETPVEQA